MSKIGERRPSMRALSGATVVAHDQHRARRGEDSCRVPAQRERVEDMLDRLEAADERERLVRQHARDEGLGADERPDVGRRRGPRRVGRLEPDGSVEPGRPQAVEERAVARADVDRTPHVRELLLDPLDECGIGRGRVPRLLAALYPASRYASPIDSTVGTGLA